MNTTQGSKEIFGHPRGLVICFLTEMWERFSFYGMKFLLVLYLTKYHLFTDSEGLDVLGAYAGLVYALPVIGGMLADRYLGMRKAVLFGGILLVLGHLGLAFEGHEAAVVNGEIQQDKFALKVFYFSLSLIIIGVGFLKPNISTIVGKLYAKDDPRRDSGFTIFYMGINIGSFLATILCGWLGETYGWGYGFGLAGIGMVFGLITFIWGQKFLEGHAEPPDPAKLKEKVFAGINREAAIYGISILFLGLIWLLVQKNHVVHTTLNAMFVVFLAWFIWFIVTKCNKIERERMIVLASLTVFTVVFWALFEQSAASMTLFADRVVDRTVVGGWQLTAVQTGSLNAMFIFLLAPFFAWLWTFLSKKKIEPNTPVKFGLGILQVGLGFGALVIGTTMPDEAGKVALIWLVLAYLLHTTGELCLSPVGLSAVTKLSVQRVVGVMMGFWFFATAYSELVAAQIAKIAAMDTEGGEVADIGVAVGIYGDFFMQLLLIGGGFGLLVLLISPLLKRGMHGIH